MVTVKEHEGLCRLINACRQGADNTTPMSLVQEMVDKIPDEIWKDTSKTILDPAAGSGTFLVAAYWKMIQAGDTHENIIGNRLFACEVNLVYLKVLRDKLGLKNIYDKDFLQFNDSMKFDVVIGNPPYQSQPSGNGTQPKAHNLWTKFSTYGFSLLHSGGIINFVTPSSWGSPSNPVFKLFKSDLCNLIYVNLDTRKFFPNVGSTFSYWSAQNSNQKSNVDLNGLNIDKSKLNYVPDNPTLETINIHSKVCWNTTNKLNWKWDTTSNHSTPGKKQLWKKEKSSEYPYEVFHTNAQTFFSKVKNTDHNSKKIYLTLSGYYTPTLSTSPISTSEIVMYLTGESEDELNNILSYVQSKIYKFIALTGKWSGYLNKQVILGLPDLGRSKKWTDVELYQYFNLTEEEINLIESTVD